MMMMMRRKVNCDEFLKETHARDNREDDDDDDDDGMNQCIKKVKMVMSERETTYKNEKDNAKKTEISIGWDRTQKLQFFRCFLGVGALSHFIRFGNRGC